MPAYQQQMEREHPRVGSVCHEIRTLVAGTVDEVHEGDYVMVRLRRSGERAPVDWGRFQADWRLGEPDTNPPLPSNAAT